MCHDFETYLVLLVVCCLDFLQLCCLHIAFQNESSGFVATFGFISVVYAFVADLFMLNQSSTELELLGAT